MKTSTTYHATARMRQRGINEEVVELIETFGVPEHDHHGGIRIMIPKKRIMDLIRKQPTIKSLLEKAKGVYLVIAADASAVITASHYYR